MRKNFIKMTLLALAGAALMATSAKAQVVYSNGDFLLGFRQVGSANDVLVDIGTFDVNSNHIFSNLGNLGATLATTFGVGWATDMNVFFSIGATTAGSSHVNFVTAPHNNGDPQPTPWNNLSTGNSIALSNKFFAQGTAYNQFTQTMGNPAVVQPNSSTDSYAAYMPGGVNDAGHANGNIAYGFFNPTTENNFGAGVANAFLNLYQLTPGGGQSQLLGFFSLSADGNTLSYMAIPEPSTYALAVFSLAGLLVVRRLRRKAPSA